MSFTLRLRLMSLILLGAMALSSMPVASVARHNDVPQAPATHHVYMPVVQTGKFRLERTFPTYGARTTGFLAVGDQAVQTFAEGVNLETDTFDIVPVENGPSFPIQPGTAIVSGSIGINPGTPLGSSVQVAGRSGPAGVVFIIAAGVAYVGYLIFRSAEGITPRQLIPAPSLPDARDWAGERSRMLDDQNRIGETSIVTLVQDVPVLNQGPPCQPFIKNGGGKWPKGWKLNVQVRTKTLVRVRVLDQNDVLVGYAEVREYGVYGHLTAWVSPYYRGDYIATVILRIAADIYASVNQQVGTMKFIADDTAKFTPPAWTCLVKDSSIVMSLGQYARIFLHASFRAAAAKLGIPPY